MLPLILLLVASTAAVDQTDKPYYDLEDAHNLFENFIQEHGKIYAPKEYVTRLEIFKQNLNEINERNALHPQTVYAVTRFADLTTEERGDRYGLRMSGEEMDVQPIELNLRPEEITAPEQWDWREHGAVTHVKDQTIDCGSCWIFSATGAIEGQYAIKHNKTLAFSEQQSLDCVPNKDGNPNCRGGYPDWVMAYHEKFGVILEKDDPYVAKEKKCQEDPKKVITKVTEYKVYQPDEETLKQLVYEKGPLAVTLDPSDLTFYRKGILHPIDCTDFCVHAVLLVGYGIENGTKYWILKDSYGPNHGEKGYIRLERGINACSMGTQYTASCTVA